MHTYAIVMAAELSCVRGYHVVSVQMDCSYRAVGEELTCRREPANASDPFAVAVVIRVVKLWGMFHGFIRNLLLRRGGSLFCWITGNGRHSSDLPQGSLEQATLYLHCCGTDFNHGLEWASLESFAGLKSLEVIL